MPELKAILSGLTEDTTPDIDADFGFSLDASADALKKVKGRSLLVLYALLASPTFTGTPAGPTASPGTNTTQLATTAYVIAEILARLASNDAMLYKGAVDCSANPNYPAADAGHTYRISVAGKIGGASGAVVEAGDIAICHVDSSASANQATVGANWDVIQLNIDGAMTTSGGTFTGAINVPDDAYDATTWNGSTAVATKNAIRDKIEAIVAGAASVSDTVYGVGWNGDTAVAPSKNAVYDKIEAVIALIAAAYSDEQAQDAIGAMIDATLEYVDATPLLRRAALTGAVTAPAGSNVTTIAADAALTGNPTAPTQGSGDNTTKIASTAFVQAAVSLAVTGLLEFISNVDCSANPNYPAGSKGDTYYVSVAGKIGGASGPSVDVGDAVICKADAAAGNHATVGSSWFILEHNLAGALLAANNLSDITSASTARSNLGLVIGTNVQAWDADLDTWATLTPSANAQSFVTAANYAAMRTLLGLGAVALLASIATANIDNDAVTYAKMQNVSAASKLIGRGSAGGSGDPEEITIGSGLSMTGTTLSASGGAVTTDQGKVYAMASGLAIF